MGQEQFKGVKIYDVIQDRSLNYYVSTNEGIYQYDFYSYKKLNCPDCKGNSFFNFTSNSSGVIYCNNLNKQIYKIEKGRLELFYELQSDEESSDLSLMIAPNGELLVSGHKIVVLDSVGKVLTRDRISLRYIGQPYLNEKNEVIYHLFGSDSLIIYYKKKIRCEKLISSTEFSAGLRFFRIGEKELAIDTKTKNQYSYNSTTQSLTQLPKNNLFERTEAFRIYETGEDIWLAGTLPGVSKFPQESYKDIIFEDYFISDVYRDSEGNLLFSTFDKGILVVPDRDLYDVIFNSKEDPVVSLYFHPASGLIAGTSQGHLIQIKGQQLKLLNTKGTRPIEVIAGNPEGTSILFDNGHIRLYDFKKESFSDIISASLKDVVAISDQEYVLGTNRGIIRLLFIRNGKFNIEWVEDAKFRIYSLEYHPIEKSIYASTSEGFICLNKNNKVDKVLNKGNDHYSNFVHYSNGIIYSAGKDGAILKIKNGEIIERIALIKEDQNFEIQKFVIYKNTFLVKSPKGFDQFNSEGKYVRSLQNTFFLPENRIIDFTVYGDSIWITHDNGIQYFNLKYLDKLRDKPEILLQQVTLNDKPIETDKPGEFANNERKLRFMLSSPTLKHQRTTSYRFKLEGYDENWNTHTFNNNEITYTALAPGKYIFRAKAINQESESKEISFQFSIALPVYLKWWFMLLAGALFTFTTILIYKRQIKIQQKKSAQINELHLSKLAAIQSQMNPHFIFNSLNSIQDLILKGDVEHSYSYITTFSNLVRKTLNYSEKDFIDFEEDLQLLELYLSLEKLRFKKDFSYSIDHNTIEDVLIPPMLIQPFVENALIHGLLHKEGEKKLSLKFELKDVLICEITDNGIGRDASMALQKRQRAGHESFAGKAIRNRFEILSEIFDGEFDYRYEDLTKNGVATGTRVILRIPIKHKY